MKRPSKHNRNPPENSHSRTKLDRKSLKSSGKSTFPRSSSTPAVIKSLQEKYETILNTTHHTEAEVAQSLNELRMLIRDEGLPENVKPPATVRSIRSRTWKCLLALYRINTTEYLNLVRPSGVYDKIKDDAFRTLKTDNEFRGRVEEEVLVRVLNAFAWKAELSQKKAFYVQGMNVLVAPFLDTMSEVEAFFAFWTFIQFNCPLYVKPCLEGVHSGLKLVDLCLQVADPQLFNYLKGKNLTAELYAFPAVCTFSACKPPLDQLLKIWDFLLAFGVHMNILCVVAQVLLLKDDVLASSSPMKLLRTSPLNADAILHRARSVLRLLSDDLKDKLIRHPYDPSVADELEIRVGAGVSFDCFE